MGSFIVFAVIVFGVLAIVKKVAAAATESSERYAKRLESSTRTIVGSAKSTARTTGRAEMDALQAWIEGRGDRPGSTGVVVESEPRRSPPPLPPREESHALELDVLRPGDGEPPTLDVEPLPPTARSAPRDVAPSAPSPSVQPARSDAPARATTPSYPEPRRAEPTRAAAPPSDDTADLAADLANALAEVDTGASGPRLSLSSSMTRPAGDVYSALVHLSGLRGDAARRVFAAVAGASRFFGLRLVEPEHLTAARLLEAARAVVRADDSLRAALAADLDRLDAELSRAGAGRPSGLDRVLRAVAPAP
ncbi:MAG: hypothetical protein R3F34_18035 [Planctomycetota bacterium]